MACSSSSPLRGLAHATAAAIHRHRHRHRHRHPTHRLRNRVLKPRSSQVLSLTLPPLLWAGICCRPRSAGTPRAAGQGLVRERVGVSRPSEVKARFASRLWRRWPAKARHGQARTEEAVARAVQVGCRDGFGSVPGNGAACIQAAGRTLYIPSRSICSSVPHVKQELIESDGVN